MICDSSQDFVAKILHSSHLAKLDVPYTLNWTYFVQDCVHQLFESGLSTFDVDDENFGYVHIFLKKCWNILGGLSDSILCDWVSDDTIVKNNRTIALTWIRSAFRIRHLSNQTFFFCHKLRLNKLNRFSLNLSVLANDPFFVAKLFIIVLILFLYRFPCTLIDIEFFLLCHRFSVSYPLERLFEQLPRLLPHKVLKIEAILDHLDRVSCELFLFCFLFNLFVLF